MVGGPTFGAARGSAAPKAALDAIIGAARTLISSLYAATGHEPRALLLAVGDDVFIRAALLHAERTDVAVADLERVGVIDVDLDGIELRIVSERAAGAAADLARTICGH